ncbi:hypothetical protein DY000_02021901 [Brassica cretica]|uniref:Uncharacterized protein n=1 Tax=Brassica cretica TaxID=69181 RepID=A0ABQ7E320_BRACR|nr:hypothetical protein DY000_02021901 [Brassica cretica]
MLPPGVLAGTTTRQDVIKLVITINRSSRLSSCSSRRDKAVAADYAAIGAQMNPHAPPEVSHLRAREVHVPPPEIVDAAFAAGKLRLRLRIKLYLFGVLCPGPWTSGWHPIPHWAIPLLLTPHSSPFQIWSLFEHLEFIDTISSVAKRRTSVCRIVWRLRPTLVDRLSCSLVCVDKTSTGGVRALSRAVAMFGSMDFGVASHTSLSDSPVAHPSLFPFSGGDGCLNLVSERVPSRFRPGMAVRGFGFHRFSMFFSF